MAKAVGLDPEEAMENIYVARACTTDHQVLLIEKATDLVKKDNIKLVVIDSLMSLFRTEYCGRGALAERQQKLGRHLATLHKLAELHDLAIFVTNHVQAKPDVFFGDPTRPIGGHVLGHSSTARIYLRKGKANTRVAKLVDHPGLPPESATFQIVEAGIRD
jgi:DNA repair protein RadA